MMKPKGKSLTVKELRDHIGYFLDDAIVRVACMDTQYDIDCIQAPEDGAPPLTLWIRVEPEGEV